MSVWWLIVILATLLFCCCFTFWCWKQKQSNDQVLSDLRKHKVTGHENPSYAPGVTYSLSGPLYVSPGDSVVAAPGLDGPTHGAPRAAVFNTMYAVPMETGDEALYMDPDNMAEGQYAVLVAQHETVAPLTGFARRDSVA